MTSQISTQTVLGRNEMQKAYRNTQKEVIELIHRLEREVNDYPAACPDYGLVGDLNNYREQLQELLGVTR